MIIWLALIIPLIAGIIMLKYFREHLIWWEVVLPMIICIIFILIFKFSVEKSITADTDYNSTLITKAAYYEEYETWVHKTCSYQTCSGTGKSRVCVTHYYDCSYCDYTPPKWVVYDSLGNNWYITKNTYTELKNKWNSTPTFVELNRYINKHLFCGKDGDKYEIMWDKNPVTSESAVDDKYYENRIQAAHSMYDFPSVSEQNIKKFKLLNYPKINNFRQNVILSNTKPISEKDQILAKYLDGKFGQINGCKLFICLYTDVSIKAAQLQKALWKGGNDNELVICIGLSKTDSITWVNAFSWTPDKRICIDVREDLSNIRTYDFEKIFNVLNAHMYKFKKKNFKEFSYLTVDPPVWASIVTYIITTLITFGLCWWAINNDIHSDDNNPWKIL